MPAQPETPMDALLTPLSARSRQPMPPASRRRLLLGGAVVVAAAAAPWLAGRVPGARGVPPGPHRFAGETMGSTFSVTLAGDGVDARLAEQARRAVIASFDDTVARLSTYEADSELSRLGRHRAAVPFELSPATLDVIGQAQQVAAESGGAFDATVAPLVAAWGFGAGAAPRGASPAGLAEAAVGWRQLEVDRGRGIARKALGGLRLDLSGIAKGDGVDRAAQALDRLGLDRYLVEAGGELRARGRNAEGRPWQVAIEQPEAWPPRARRIVPLSGASIATSGDYRNWYERDGRRLSHTIDPHTREPVRHALASVSVVHPSCALADAWATALFVAGPERGLAMARERGLAALFVVRESGGRLRDLESPAFAGLG
jgi:thiamine biosynthesis lipoprotein